MAKQQKHAQACVVKIDPRIYCLRVIHSCAYTFLDKAYLYIDGDPKKKVRVRIRAKDGSDPRALAREFLNSLLSASIRYQVAQENRKIRELIIGTALFSVSEERLIREARRAGVPVPHGAGGNRHAAVNESPAVPPDFSGAGKKAARGKDPFDIAVPFERRHGKKNKAYL